MIVIILKFIAGAGVSISCKLLCDKLVRFLLSRREKEYIDAPAERTALFIVMGLFGAAIAALVPLSAKTVYMFLLLIISEVLSVTDLHHRIIPNDAVLAMLGVSLLFGIFSLFGVPGFPAFGILSSAAGLVGCFIIFMLPAFMSKNIGAGDVKLAAACGFCLGLWNSLICIVLMGLAVLIYSFLQRSMPMLTVLKSRIPMGPFLAGSMMVVLLLGNLPFYAELLSAFPVFPF